MKIDSYSFGHIVINGKAYTSDVIIYEDHVNASWWRKEGHLLQWPDISEIVKPKPDILIIGSGYSGVMSVPPELVDRIEALGIEVKVERTTKAVELFNGLQGKKSRVIAALHITC
jgi:hypothetical protein